MKLSQDAIRRMVGNGNGIVGVGGGGGDPASLSGYATESFVENGYLSKSFYRRMFKAYNDSDEVTPNDQNSEINKIVSSVSLDVTGNISATGNIFASSFVQIGNIRLVYDSETNAVKVVKSDGFTAASLYATGSVSSVGYSSSGGGGGGIVLTEPLSSINTSGLGVPTQANVGIIWNGTTWVYGATGGGGSGTVTSIATGTGLTGGPITSIGTIEISSTYQGYIQHGETAYGWGNHASAGYATPSSVATQMENYAYISNGAIHISNNSITPLTQHQVVDGTFWGQSWSNRGTVSGSINAGSNGGQITGFHSIELNNYGTLSGYGGFIDFHFNGSSSDYTSRIIEDASGRLFLDASVGVRIGSALLSWDGDNNALKIQKIDGTAANFYATGGVSALGMSAGASSIDAMTFNYVTVNNQLKFGTNNDVTMYVDDMFYIDSNLDVSINGVEMFDNYVRANRLYLDSTRYIFISSGKLYFYDGSSNKEIAFIN